MHLYKVWKKIKLYIFLFRINKPFLAIPFTVTVAFLVSKNYPDFVKLGWLLIAVFAGFMAGNAFNAITDKAIDESNPRTMNRPLASNQLTLREVLTAMFSALSVVLIATFMLNRVYLFFLPIPIILCLGYSLSKRYTWLCHCILGITNATCPVASYGIFSGWFDWKIILIGAIVCFWTMGFELIYSMQDIEYDRKNGMYSIPSVFGIKIAHNISILCHIIMTILVMILIYFLNLSAVFCVGVFIGVLILFFEHSLVKKDTVKNPELAFNLNQIFSIQLMLFAILEKIF